MPPSLRYLERLWGASETIKFIIVCVGASNIIAFAFNWIEYIATGSELFLYVLSDVVLPGLISNCDRYGMQYRGQMALQIAVAVAFTQLIPEHQIQLFGIYRVRVKVPGFVVYDQHNIQTPYIDGTNGLIDVVHNSVFHWAPMPLDRYSIRVVR